MKVISCPLLSFTLGVVTILHWPCQWSSLNIDKLRHSNSVSLTLQMVQFLPWLPPDNLLVLYGYHWNSRARSRVDQHYSMSSKRTRINRASEFPIDFITKERVKEYPKCIILGFPRNTLRLKADIIFSCWSFHIFLCCKNCYQQKGPIT